MGDVRASPSPIKPQCPNATNIFPDVDDLDARDAGRHVEVFLDVRIEGKHTPVTVKLLGDLWLSDLLLLQTRHAISQVSVSGPASTLTIR
jgi:hypothetical protein